MGQAKRKTSGNSNSQIVETFKPDDHLKIEHSRESLASSSHEVVIFSLVFSLSVFCLSVFVLRLEEILGCSLLAGGAWCLIGLLSGALIRSGISAVSSLFSALTLLAVLPLFNSLYLLKTSSSFNSGLFLIVGLVVALSGRVVGNSRFKYTAIFCSGLGLSYLAVGWFESAFGPKGLLVAACIGFLLLSYLEQRQRVGASQLTIGNAGVLGGVLAALPLFGFSLAGLVYPSEDRTFSDLDFEELSALVRLTGDSEPGTGLIVLDSSEMAKSPGPANFEAVSLFSGGTDSDPGLFSHLEQFKKPYQNIVLASSEPKQFSAELIKLYRKHLLTEGRLVALIDQRVAGEDLIRRILFSLRKNFAGLRIFSSKEPGVLLVVARKTEEDAPLLDRPNQNTLSLVSREIWLLPVELMPGAEIRLTGPEHKTTTAGIEVWEKNIIKNNKWFYRLFASKRSLLGEWLKPKSLAEVVPFLPGIIKESCGGSKIGLKEPGWRWERSLCRDSVVAAMVAGKIGVPETMAADVNWVKDFLDQKKLNKELNWKQELARYGMFDSIFLKLSPHDLVNRLEPCFKGLVEGSVQCQNQVIRTLSINGKHEVAAELAEKLPLLEVTRSELDDYLKKNRRVHFGG